MQDCTISLSKGHDVFQLGLDSKELDMTFYRYVRTSPLLLRLRLFLALLSMKRTVRKLKAFKRVHGI